MMINSFNATLLGLALSAFTSATVLPGTSEAALLAMLHTYPKSWLIIWLTASIANGVGSMVSYAMGRCLPKHKMPSEKVLRLLQRWGVWLLLFAWVPVLGDALPIAAGWLRLNPYTSMLMLLLGKALRYALIAAAWLPFTT